MADQTITSDARALADPVLRDAEAAVLGAVLVNKHALPAVLEEGLKPQHFGSWRHAVLFTAAVLLRDEKKSIDPITLNDRLDRLGHLQAVGGREYVHTLLDMYFLATRAREYAKIILSRHRARARVRVGEALAAGGLDEAGAIARLGGSDE